MIAFYAILILFIVGYYSLWSGDMVIDKIIYNAFLYFWLSTSALYNAFKDSRYKVGYMFVSVYFAVFFVYEISCSDLKTAEYREAVNSPGPVFWLTILTMALFIIYEIIQWKRKSV